MLSDVLLCLLAADLITGLVHWIEDAYGLPTWPVIGRTVIADNIEHHLHPAAIAEGTFWYRNQQPIAAAAAVVAAAWCVGGLSWQLALVAGLASLGNEVHAWNHTPTFRQPRLVRWLHDAGVIQQRTQHARHHREPFNRYYCTLTSFTNAALDAVRFWQSCELMLRWAGIRTKRMTAERHFV
jgi:ubiquitin-conjugating enzyme E2 variant